MANLLLLIGCLGMLGAGVVASLARTEVARWPQYLATYDSCTVLQDGDSEITRLRFWYTDTGGQRRLAAAESALGGEFRIGDTVRIAVNPADGTVAVLLLYRHAIAIACLSGFILFIGVAIRCL